MPLEHFIKKILIAIPVYNEEKTITKVIAGIRVLVSFDILIIDDGSTDNSLEVIKKLKPKKIIRHLKTMGYGKSVIDIFNYAIKNKYLYLIKLDADLQHEPHYIPDFLKEIPNSDIVSGSRYMSSSAVVNPPPKSRQNINKKITRILNKITQFNLTDSFCGFKAYKVKSLKKLKLSEKGYGFPLQFWIQTKKNNLKIKEIPISLIYIKDRKDFQGELRNPAKRLKYYLNVIKNELSR